MFDRINKGSDLLKEMEQRKALIKGDFTDFLYEVTSSEQYIDATPQNKYMEKRQERQELALRFFALRKTYDSFPRNKGVAKYLDEFMMKCNIDFTNEIQSEMKKSFNDVVYFVSNNFRYKFSKTHNNQVSRPYFEAISIGVYLALKENPNLHTDYKHTDKWICDKKFNEILTSRHRTHSPENIKARIEFVRDKLLNRI